MKRFCGNVLLILKKKPFSLIFSLTSAFTCNYSCSLNTMAEINNSWLLWSNTKRVIYSIKYRFKCIIFSWTSISSGVCLRFLFVCLGFFHCIGWVLYTWMQSLDLSALSTNVFRAHEWKVHIQIFWLNMHETFCLRFIL